MLDYCCYGALVSRWYIGEQAVAAMGMRANLDSQWGDGDDNAAMIVRFPAAMALLEGSWTTWDHGVPTGPIVYGTTGTLVVESRDGKRIVRLERGHGQTTIYEPGLEELLRRNTAESRLSFTTDLADAVRRSLICFIAVGTPPGEDGSADASAVLRVAAVRSTPRRNPRYALGIGVRFPGPLPDGMPSCAALVYLGMWLPV